MSTVFYHADDYGISINQSKEIVECYEKGKLNSLSVMPNSQYINEVLELLDGLEIRKVVHLNFIEGYPVSDKKKIPLLVNAKGTFKCTFGYILKMNYSDKITRNEIKQQLKTEIECQIKNVIGNDKNVSVDSHQHFHMIPVVFEALMEVMEENDYTLDYLRIPVDPLSPFLCTPSLWMKVNAIDLVKWLVLRLLNINIKKKTKAMNCNIPVFFGILFTCHMEKQYVDALLDRYEKVALAKSKDLELMFHPGGIYNKEELLDSSNRELELFYQSEYRKKEKKALIY